jgi:hypothetical protein
MRLAQIQGLEHTARMDAAPGHGQPRELFDLRKTYLHAGNAQRFG